MKNKFLDMTPINGRILIRVLEDEIEEYGGNIVLTQAASKERTQYAVIEKVNKESELKEGNIVVFPLHTGAIFQTGSMYDNERTEYRVIKESDLLGVIYDS